MVHPFMGKLCGTNENVAELLPLTAGSQWLPQPAKLTRPTTLSNLTSLTPLLPFHVTPETLASSLFLRSARCLLSWAFALPSPAWNTLPLKIYPLTSFKVLSEPHLSEKSTLSILFEMETPAPHNFSFSQKQYLLPSNLLCKLTYLSLFLSSKM